jgi:hypothetical protein
MRDLRIIALAVSAVLASAGCLWPSFPDPVSLDAAHDAATDATTDATQDVAHDTSPETSRDAAVDRPMPPADTAPTD